jgi:hypothetical protein
MEDTTALKLRDHPFSCTSCSGSASSARWPSAPLRRCASFLAVVVTEYLGGGCGGDGVQPCMATCLRKSHRAALAAIVLRSNYQQAVAVEVDSRVRGEVLRDRDGSGVLVAAQVSQERGSSLTSTDSANSERFRRRCRQRRRLAATCPGPMDLQRAVRRIGAVKPLPTRNVRSPCATSG